MNTTKRKRMQLKSEQPAAFKRICKLVSAGMPLRKALERTGTATLTFYRMLREESEIGKERRTLYARAKQEQLEAFAEQTIALADTPMLTRRTRRSATGTSVDTYDNVERSRLAIETRKWHLAKLMPKTYGDRVEHEHKGDVTLNLTPDEAKVL